MCSYARGFRVPFGDAIPALGVVGTVGLMFTQEAYIWLLFAVWMGAGLMIYGFYGMRRSRLRAAGRHRAG